ncbi:hypothetical protein COO60DRAFT_1483455 [Scenedesmus sp. NREL 46B-D3]|nr:hypothetical protein COO60DRAFT_1483455 [Scenedesmus sp. NREL 46B-D3]
MALISWLAAAAAAGTSSANTWKACCSSRRCSAGAYLQCDLKPRSRHCTSAAGTPEAACRWPIALPTPGVFYSARYRDYLMKTQWIP